LAACGVGEAEVAELQPPVGKELALEGASGDLYTDTV
jgi:hypothetical protein